MGKITHTFLLIAISTLTFGQQKNIVLELFTSQGCSSCPRADKLLKQVSESKQADNILALAYHVDYWNRLGWEDPYSKASYSEYQQQYGRKFGGRSIYTPQLVINGKKHIVGSDGASLQQALNQLKNKEFAVQINLTKVKKEGSTIWVDYTFNIPDFNRLNILVLLKEKTTIVERGENRNKTLVDAHIVYDKKILKKEALLEEVKFENIPYSLEEIEVIAYAQNRDLSVVGATKWVE